MRAIRNLYQDLGVDQYYSQEGSGYENPHFPQIQTLLTQNQHRINYENTLDFCCGGGEVSKVLQALGHPLPQASDPYTQEAYRKNMEQDCWDFSFEDVIRGKLIGQFSSIICSFAMHLCPQKQLFPLVYQLFQCTTQLVIITPHKRPELENLTGIALQFSDFTLTKRSKKVFLKSYHD